MIQYVSHRSWLQPWSWPQRPVIFTLEWLARKGFQIPITWEAKRVKDLQAECKKLEQYQECFEFRTWVLNNIHSDPQRNAVWCASRSSIKQQIALNGFGYRYILPYSKITMACALAVMYEMDCGMQEEGIAEEALAAAQNKARNGLQSGSGWRSVHKVHTEMLSYILVHCNIYSWLDGFKVERRCIVAAGTRTHFDWFLGIWQNHFAESHLTRASFWSRLNFLMDGPNMFRKFGLMSLGYRQIIWF